MYIITILTFYQNSPKRIALINLTIFILFFLNSFSEFIFAIFILNVLKLIKVAKIRSKLILFSHALLFIIIGVIFIQSTLDFYFFRNVIAHFDLIEPIGYSLLYKNVHHFVTEFFVCNLKTYSLTHLNFSNLQRVYARLLYQTIISNLYLNIDFTSFKKILCIFQFGLGLSFILYLAISSTVLWLPQKHTKNKAV